jgi:hypothetical protein
VPSGVVVEVTVAAEVDKALVRRLFEDVRNHGNIELANEIVHERHSLNDCLLKAARL